METLPETVSNLWAWLQTWLDEKGGVHGYIVHHHRDNLRMLSPDTWTQAPCILGLLRIYQKTGYERWLGISSKLCDFLVNSYIHPLHVYRNSNHENKPLGQFGLIDNAISSYALLEVAKEKKKMGSDWKGYHNIARDNILNLLSRLWDDSVDALLSPAHDAQQHIHNMNSITIMSLIALAELEDDRRYIEEYAQKIGKYIIACQVKKGTLKGAYPYRDGVQNYITLYSLITCLGLSLLYGKTMDSNLLSSIELAVRHIAKFIDPETGLVCHYHRNGYPQWIPDTMLFFLNLNIIRREDQDIDVAVDDGELLSRVLSRQYKTGGFPLSLGFEDIWHKKRLPSRPLLRRWRDLLATPNWNSWNFWTLSELLPEKTHVNGPTIKFPLTLETDAEEDEGPYRIVENVDNVVFYSKDEEPLGIFNKKDEVASLCKITERNESWRIKGSLNKYPDILYRLILEVPDIF